MKLKNTNITILESYQKEMINRLHTVREKEFLKNKIAELSKPCEAIQNHSILQRRLWELQEVRDEDCLTEKDAWEFRIKKK